MNTKLATVILAAGKGKRMRNPDKSKVMFELDNKPMIGYVIDLAIEINSDLIIPIVGHQKQTVIDYIETDYSEHLDKIFFAHQDEQLGTGHAVMQTKDLLSNFDGDVLVLSGDVPLLSVDTLQQFIDFHNLGNYKASLISAIMDEPAGYGRIIRDDNIDFTHIVEDKDASEEELRVNEINSGIYLIDARAMFEALSKINTENSQGEYYLTDVFKYFFDKSFKIGADPVYNQYEITGVNTIEQLEELEQIKKSL